MPKALKFHLASRSFCQFVPPLVFPWISGLFWNGVINHFLFDQNKRPLFSLSFFRWPWLWPCDGHSCSLNMKQEHFQTTLSVSRWYGGVRLPLGSCDLWGGERKRSLRMERILHGSISSLWHTWRWKNPQRVGQIWRRKPDIAMKISVSPHLPWHKTSAEREGAPKTWHVTSPGWCLDSSDPCGGVQKIKYLYSRV